MEQLFASASISISELKKNPSAVIAAAGGFPVAVLNRNKPSAYLVPAETWAELIERLDDIGLAETVRARAGEEPVEIDLNDL